MKKLLSLLFVGTCLISGITHAADEIVFVDLQEVFKRFYKTQLAQDQILQQSTDVKLERETMEADIEIIKNATELLRTDSRDTTLSDEVRESKRDQLEEKLVELQKRNKEMIDYSNMRNNQLKQQNIRMTHKILDEIQEIIANYAKEKGYGGVIDRSAKSSSNSPIIFYSNPKKDITADVISVLNKGRGEEYIEEDILQDQETNTTEK